MKNARDRHDVRTPLRYVIFALTLALLFAISGCAKKSLPSYGDPVPRADTATLDTRDAQAAWDAKDYARSEMLYMHLLDHGTLSPDEKKTALYRLGRSAVEIQHPHIALDALDQLSRLDPASRKTWEWHSIFADALLSQGKRGAAQDHLRALTDNTSYTWELRTKAAVALAVQQWQARDFDDSLRELDSFYAAAPEPVEQSQAGLERQLSEALHEIATPTLNGLEQVTPAERRLAFPYSVLLLEKARRLAADSASWPRAWNLFTELNRDGQFADKNLVARSMAPFMENRAKSTGGVALALPLSGPYSEIGWKIVRGAGVAQWKILMAGGQMDIRTVNTESPDWMDQIKALPKGYSVVGGPLRTAKFKQLEKSGMLSNRPFFSFLPSLGSATEGEDAWRFFPSQKDQLRVLLNLAVDNLDMHSLGVLYPDEKYGARLSELFSQAAADRLAHVAGNTSYPPGQPTKWGKSVRTFLAQARSDSGAQRLQAVFLPDSWETARQLVPQLFYYDEDRLLILGPSLWAQGLEHDKNIEARYFRLAVFPSAWWPENPSAPAQTLRTELEQDASGRADLWTAIGYDFIRLAERLGQMEEPSATDVNRALQGAQEMDWSMAPLEWTYDGKASQQLFLFRPTEDGYRPIDPELLSRRIMRIRALHDKREVLRRQAEIDNLQKALDKKPSDKTLKQRVQALKIQLESRLEEMSSAQ